jgi:uncharacterized protein YndB with AHSA1/START domain
VLPAEVDDVWEALTDPDALRDWLAAEVDLDLQPGGAARFDSAGDHRRGVVEEVEPGRRLSFTWWPVGAGGEDDGSPSRVAFSLEPVPSGTLLTVVEESLAGTASLAPRALAAWGRRCTALVWSTQARSALPICA